MATELGMILVGKVTWTVLVVVTAVWKSQLLLHMLMQTLDGQSAPNFLKYECQKG